MKGWDFKMRQEQFKNIYQQIQLSEKQKDALWQRINTVPKQEPVRKKIFLPARIAACFAVLIMSGMTVFAANELSLIDKIADAMNLLTQNEEVLSEDQKNIYAEYGQALNTEIGLENGTLKLDAALFDESHLLIPFRYVFHSDVSGYEDLTAGANLNETALYQINKVYHKDTDTFMSQFSFCIGDESRQPEKNLARFLITDPIIEESGTISGSFLLSAYEYKYFLQGNVIQLVRTADVRDAAAVAKDSVLTAEDMESINITEPYTEFTLEKTLEQYELTIDAENAAALKNMGISVEQMSISPLSLCYSGKGTHTRALSASITVILKDGSVIENSGNGGGYALSDANRDNTSFSFFASKLFAVPVLIEEVAEIHIQDHRGTDIHIPVVFE